MRQKFLLPIFTVVLLLGSFIACKKTKSDGSSTTASISTLSCTGSTFSATATINTAYTGTASVPYTGGNGLAYTAGTAIASTGVTGLTATLTAGTLASGAGNLNYTITGTPSSSGTAAFALSFGGQTCSMTLVVNAAGTTNATVTALNCSSAVTTAGTINTVYSATATVPYTGGNGGTYSAAIITSTGVTGLTAVLAAGSVASGAGNLTYTVTGTPATAGTASFAVSFGGQTCNFTITVNSAAADCSSATGVAKLICLCDAFKATLSSSQISALQLSYTFSNIKTWSNLPAAMSARLGLKFSTLSATQLAAAKAIVQQMTGTTANEGYDEVQQVWLADDYLNANGGGSDYGSGNYYIAFFGTPAATGTFEIMETGHHKTVANTYTNGVMVGYTPHFEASEPISWTSGGTTYAPIAQERDAFVTFLASLTSAQQTAMKTSSSFSDLVLVPGQEWAFPTTRLGSLGSTLTTAQQTLLLNVIKTYTNDIDDANAATVLATYTSELANTYITYSGTTAMTTKYDYFRIDGPHVWIEFIVAGGIVFPSGTHIHSIWRDRVNDYAGTH